MLTGIDSSSVLTGTGNSQVVTDVDPDNPVVTEGQDLSSSETFLTLMLEQLKNQDPMDPMDSNTMTQQLAALNTVEQLISMNSTLADMADQSQLADSTAMIGQYVEGIDANGSIITGVVDQVQMVEGEAALLIDDQMLLIEQLYTIGSASE